MIRPAQFSNLDTALLLAATVAWLVSFLNYDAGNITVAALEVTLACLFIALFFARETKRWRWELR